MAILEGDTPLTSVTRLQPVTQPSTASPMHTASAWHRARVPIDPNSIASASIDQPSFPARAPTAQRALRPLTHARRHAYGHFDRPNAVARRVATRCSINVHRLRRRLAAVWAFVQTRFAGRAL